MSEEESEKKEQQVGEPPTVSAEEVEQKPAAEEKKEVSISAVDAAKATRVATEYLESIYGNLSMLLFRIEQVNENGDESKYFVLCSLLTNVGGPRRYYFIKVNIQDGNLISISSGFRNPDTNKIDWKEENLPPGEK